MVSVEEGGAPYSIMAMVDRRACCAESAIFCRDLKVCSDIIQSASSATMSRTSHRSSPIWRINGTVLFIGVVACFHAPSHSNVSCALPLCALEKEMICFFDAGPKPMRRQSAADLMSVPHHECLLHSSVNAVRTASAHPSRGPNPMLLI